MKMQKRAVPFLAMQFHHLITNDDFWTASSFGIVSSVSGINSYQTGM
jgi:hypothetical protein